MEKIDKFFNKVLPKKFIVFTLASVLIFIEKIDGQMWGYIAMAYLTVNVTQKFVGKNNEKIR